MDSHILRAEKEGWPEVLLTNDQKRWRERLALAKAVPWLMGLPGRPRNEDQAVQWLDDVMKDKVGHVMDVRVHVR